MNQKKPRQGINSGLGRSIVKASKPNYLRHSSNRHSGSITSELTSITDQSSLENFLYTAELARSDFTANREIRIVEPESTIQAKSLIQQECLANDLNKLLTIPRRPKWSEKMTLEELEDAESSYFLKWRAKIGEIERSNVNLTPFENNFEVWRQFWRVIEKSDVIIQILDARNPLLYRCEDMEKYVKEVSNEKENWLLLNKSDFLDSTQREFWFQYFKRKNIQVLFWSAIVPGDQEKLDYNLNVDYKLDYDQNVEHVPLVPDGNYVHENNSSLCEYSLQNKFIQLKLEDVVSNGFEKKSSTISDQIISKDPLNFCVQNLFQNENTHFKSDLNDSNYVKSKPFVEDDYQPTNLAIEREFILHTNTTPLNSNFKQSKITSFFPIMKQTPKPNIQEGACLHPQIINQVGNEYIQSHLYPDKPELNNQEKENFKIDDKLKNFHPSSKVLTRLELVNFFKYLHFKNNNNNNNKSLIETKPITIGMVGYPNVGKSSTINSIIEFKKVSVSTTPGKTKHLQTILLDENIILCDCPGLVFPNCVSTRAQMFASGILSIDKLRDCIAPVQYICRLIPKSILECQYGVKLEADTFRPQFTNAEDFMTCYAKIRGFMTSNGEPDCSRAARIILKDFVNGILCYCKPPPDAIDSEFNSTLLKFASECANKVKSSAQPSRKKILEKEMDNLFFSDLNEVKVVHKTKYADNYKMSYGASSDRNSIIEGKPWKKHYNFNKNEKIRRKKNMA